MRKFGKCCEFLYNPKKKNTITDYFKKTTDTKQRAAPPSNNPPPSNNQAAGMDKPIKREFTDYKQELRVKDTIRKTKKRNKIKEKLKL